MALMCKVLRIGVTLTVVALTLLIGWRLWDFYTLSPWTRDAIVQAKVVNLAPDVSGTISQFDVADNQYVHKGDILFVINQDRFKVAVQKAAAIVDMQRQALQFAQDSAQRNRTLTHFGTISEATDEQSSADAQESLAQLQEAQADLDAANIDLARTTVRSPVNGYVTHLTASAGDYASSGQGVMAVVDSDSFYVDAYFIETKLPAIQPGARVKVRLMAGDAVITGTVEGLSRAIADRDAGSGLLAVVNPNFQWIRLAQRIPVRIKLDSVPPNVRLIAGLSCTVVIDQTPAAAAARD